MYNQPLTSGDHGKLLIFVLLMIPSILFPVGVVPTIFLAFGVFMMKKTADFSSIETAVKNFKGYVGLALTGLLLFLIYSTHRYVQTTDEWDRRRDADYITFCFAAACVCIAYMLAVHFLFLKPLRRHREWVEVNGIFTSTPKSAFNVNTSLDIDIIKGERLRNYSVADELTKWAKLKEDGHISELEFSEARKKLLSKA